MITLNNIRQRLTESIKLSGMSQTELANKLNVKQQTISCYLSGKALPALDTLANLCKIIDVSPSYILCFDDDESGRRNNIINSFNKNSGNINFH